MGSPMERVELDTQVAIVGAGPAGLAAAIELGSRGIACVLLERTERGGYAPRAKTTHTRAREHMRRWGIAFRGRLSQQCQLRHQTWRQDDQAIPQCAAMFARAR
jgi:2-polyprenyl-6-methoxyphenol hydroxylase-like FAD-dependent oxidoreductase